MSLRGATLGLLMDRPMTGYEIKRYFSEGIKNFWSVSDGQLYPTLKQMLRDRLVQVKVEPKLNTANRRVYSITPAGREAFLKWMREPVTKFTEMREPFAIKMIFFDKLSREEILEHIEAQRKLALDVLDEYRKVRGTFSGEFTGYQRLVMEVGIFFVEFRLMWLARFHRLVRTGKVSPGMRLLTEDGARLMRHVTELAFAESRGQELKRILSFADGGGK